MLFLFSVPSLYSWLKEWKKRADLEEKRNQKGEKEDKEHQGADGVWNNICSFSLGLALQWHELIMIWTIFSVSNNFTDSLDSLDFKGNESDIEEEINLCNTVLITGPPGVGKTAAVYACAQELGFKVCGAFLTLLFFLFVINGIKTFAIQYVYFIYLFILNAIADIWSQRLLPAQW